MISRAFDDRWHKDDVRGGSVVACSVRFAMLMNRCSIVVVLEVESKLDSFVMMLFGCLLASLGRGSRMFGT